MLQVDATATIGGMPCRWTPGKSTGHRWTAEMPGGPSGSGPITINDRTAEVVYRRRHIEEGLQAAGLRAGAGPMVGLQLFRSRDDHGLLARSRAQPSHRGDLDAVCRPRMRADLPEGRPRERFRRHALAGRRSAGLDAMGLKLFGDQAHKMAERDRRVDSRRRARRSGAPRAARRIQHRDRHIVRSAAGEDLAHRHDGRTMRARTRSSSRSVRSRPCWPASASR